ncbi:MAG: hypothetical protein ACKN9W_20025, partial [Methylococcus sp.]
PLARRRARGPRSQQEGRQSIGPTSGRGISKGLKELILARARGCLYRSVGRPFSQTSGLHIPGQTWGEANPT